MAKKIISKATPAEIKQRLLASATIITVVAESMGIEIQMDLVDSKFKNLNINKHRRAVLEGINKIKDEISPIAQKMDAEFFDYEYTVAIHRCIRMFILNGVHPNAINKFCDDVEAKNPNLNT